MRDLLYIMSFQCGQKVIQRILQLNEFSIGRLLWRLAKSYKLFPAWGFGGSMYNGSVSHCFNLNGNTGYFEVKSIMVEGVQGIMAAYRNGLHTVSLHGPTLFGQIINQAAEFAAQSLSSSSNRYRVGKMNRSGGFGNAFKQGTIWHVSILILKSQGCL